MMQTIRRKGTKMINNNDLYWLAGIIDGEGCLIFGKRNGIHRTCNDGKGQFSFITRIQVGNTDMEMIKRISEIFYDLGVKFYYGLHNPHKRFPNAKRYLTINVEGYRSTKKILNAIIDKLWSGQKVKEAKIMLEYIKYRLALVQERGQNGCLMAKQSEENFLNNDIRMVMEFKKARQYQVPPPTTKRKASIPLSW